MVFCEKKMVSIVFPLFLPIIKNQGDWKIIFVANILLSLRYNITAIIE